MPPESSQPPGSIRLILADDHPLVLKGLEALLAAEPDCEILACCANGRETLQAVRLHQPDILLLDSRMSGTESLEVIRILAQERSLTRVIFHAETAEEDVVNEAVRLGVRGVVFKEWPTATLLQCIRKVHADEYWVERRSAAEALEKLIRKQPDRDADVTLLTPRHQEILALLCEGLRNKAIGERLSISEATVKVHLRNMCAKLHVKGRLALLRYARDNGWF